MDDFFQLIPAKEAPTTSIVADTTAPCIACGTPTKFIDYCSETRFCSKECQDKFYDEISTTCPEY